MLMSEMSTRLVLAALCLTSCLAAFAEDFVPFVIFYSPAADAQIAFPCQPIAPDGSRVTARDGHFWLEGRRYRVWGVNTCFGASVLGHAEAEKVALRLAAGGVNCVRIHHLDSANYPRGIWDPKNPTQLDPQALDHLDYYIDQLARHGIRVNLNLHVGRMHSKFLGLPEGGKGYANDKMVDLFTPELITAQRDYARALLTHVNAYRKVRYADDAAISFVEINNEDSLFLWSWRANLPSLPEFYAKILQGKYAPWLKDRYGSIDKLRAAWAPGSSPLGENLLPPLAAPGSRSDAKAIWRIEQHEKCQAVARQTPDGLRLEIAASDSVPWHLQYNVSGVPLQGGRYYTLLFRARADKNRSISYGAGQAHEPWGNLGLADEATLTGQWREFRQGFTATADETNARVSFSLGGGDLTGVELADVRLCPGGRIGLDQGESPEEGNVVVFPPSVSPAREADEMLFLVETEKAYWDGMVRFIKDDLGCQALLTGTSVFGPGNLYAQSGLDYIDGHRYWKHPHFPLRPWDAANWTVGQAAMVDHPGESTLEQLAGNRLAGKPYTVSEYNHSAPNDYQAECVPMVATFAATQDWDGVWLFSYLHRESELDRDSFNSFFDIDANPGKWGFVPAGAVIFRFAQVAPLSAERIVSLATSGQGALDASRLQAEYENQWAVMEALPKLSGQDLVTSRLFVTFDAGRKAATASAGAPAPSPIIWQAADGRGSFQVHSPGATVFVGHRQGGESGGPIALSLPEFAAVTVTPLDGAALEDSHKVLVTACGRCENVDMAFSADRTTVGVNWGKGPVRIEAVTATLRLGGNGWTCHALKSDASLGAEVPVHGNTVELSPAYGTMWYLLSR